jgi:hypothetical protein
MRIVDDRKSDVAQEVSLLRQLAANRRFKSLELFRDRQIRQKSGQEKVPTVVTRILERSAT